MTNYIQCLPNELIDEIYHNLHTMNIKELSEEIYDIREKNYHEAICLIKYFQNTPKIVDCPLQTAYDILELVICMYCSGYLEGPEEFSSYLYSSNYSILWDSNTYSIDELEELLYKTYNEVCYEKGISLKQLIDNHKEFLPVALRQFDESTKWVEDNVN